MLSHEYQDFAVSILQSAFPLDLNSRELSGSRNMTDCGNKRQTCYYFLRRRGKDRARPDLGRDDEGAELCSCGGDCRLLEVIELQPIIIVVLLAGHHVKQSVHGREGSS